ncbi:hypothetical protein QBC38DRAFT_505375 [Podospora fimiseda]|uniref:Uncharacterized protein n=1 Tax=Podospora fimiseda TaxID=252190 RepID=A0AAN6YMS9_9PEZI|nr:hypothetical protein QBC38DRAFT_505375 [Podospora fimiseda]
MFVNIHDISVPLLTGEDNLEIWKSSLLDALEARGLDDYVLQVVPEPTDAALAKIISLLKNNGWQMNEKDPKVTFDLVEKTIHTTGRINAAQMFLEFVQLRRSQFDSMHSYITRLTTLKTRLTGLNYAIPEVGLMSVLLAGVKDSYPMDYNRWYREFDQDSLHWEDFIKELTRIGNSERGDLRLPLVETRKAKLHDQARSTSSNGNNPSEKPRKERTICTTCNKQTWSNFIHHDKCGKHIPKDGQCYWCDPGNAPNSWRNKQSVLNMKKATTSTTAAISNNTNGLMTPSSTTPSSNLLFAGNFALLDHAPTSPSTQDFYQSPRC